MNWSKDCISGLVEPGSGSAILARMQNHLRHFQQEIEE